MRLHKRITILLTLFMLFWIPGCDGGTTGDMEPETVFKETLTAIQNHYYRKKGETVKNADLIRAASAGLGSRKVSRLEDLVEMTEGNTAEKGDRKLYRALSFMLHSLPNGMNDFVPPESLSLSLDPLRDSGVGMVIRYDGPGKFYFMDSLEASASHREEIPLGQYILQVDGIAAEKIHDMDEMVGRIKGPRDTKVHLTMESGEYDLIRSAVNLQNKLTSTWMMNGRKILEYIQIRAAFPGAAENIRNHVLTLDQRDAVVLDLRKLHLGMYEESFRIADLFINEGELGRIVNTDNEVHPFTSDATNVHTNKLYIILSGKPSPYAIVIAKVLSTLPTVKIVAPENMAGDAYLTRKVKISGGIELRLTGGEVLDAKGKGMNAGSIPIALNADSYLPSRPPVNEPRPEDPAQRIIAEDLNIPVRSL